MTNESKIDLSRVWYLGNNRHPNLHIVKPAFDAPLFLTDDKGYAFDYADYGVWKVNLDNEKTSKILDFSNDTDVKKLKWNPTLVSQIQSGKTDLNSIAAGLYNLFLASRSTTSQDKVKYLRYISPVENTPAWIGVAKKFNQKWLARKNVNSPIKSQWKEYPDYAYLIQMWLDIKLAGFDGFTHREFGKQILAIFDLKFIAKISIKKIKE